MTESRLYRLFFNNWQRKILAIFTAMIVWLFVNHSITDTKVLPNIPIKIINIPTDKTIVGLLPNGTLSKRITLTLSGSKDVIQEVEPSDIEVVLDASAVETNEWIVVIGKKNLVSLNPDINLANSVTQVEHPDLVIHFSKLLTVKVPINILPPIGEAPQGFTLLDVWPQRLYQTITASEEEIAEIQAQKLQFEIDLNQISRVDLEAIRSVTTGAIDNNEVNYYIPAAMRKVYIPYSEGVVEEINDPEAKNLHVAFLIKQWLPLDFPLPIRVFYPVQTLSALNPGSHPLLPSHRIQALHNETLYKPPFYLYGVSKFFLDVVKNNLEISIIAAPPSQREVLEWSLNVVNAQELENTFVALIMAGEQPKQFGGGSARRRELSLRQRFRNYLQHLVLYQKPDHKLILDCVVTQDGILVK